MTGVGMGPTRARTNPAAHQGVGLLPVLAQSFRVTGACAQGVCALPVLPISCTSPVSMPCQAAPCLCDPVLITQRKICF